MKERNQSLAASSLTFLAGAWLLVSPIFISISGAALVSLLVVGSVVAVAGLVQMAWDSTIPSWIAALAVAYLFVSAFTFTVSNSVAWNEVVTSIVTFFLAAWDGVEVAEYRRQHHGHGITA